MMMMRIALLTLQDQLSALLPLGDAARLCRSKLGDLGRGLCPPGSQGGDMSVSRRSSTG